MTDDIQARLLAHAARDARAPFLLAPGRATATYGDLARLIAHTRERFAAWGIARGDIVVTAPADRPLGCGLFAALPAASTIVVLSPSLAAAACGELLDRLRARAVVVPPGADTPLAEAAGPRGIARIDATPHAEVAGAFTLALRDAGRTLDDPPPRRDPGYAYVGVTSGTTARPKLVPCPHLAVLAVSAAVGDRLAVTPDDTSALLTPLHLANAQRTALLLPLVRGASVLCLPEADIDALVEALARGCASYVTASFTMLRALLERIGPGGRLAAPRLRFVRIASGALDPAEIVALERALGAPAVVGLATTETGIVTQQPLPPAPRRAGGLGTTLLGELRLVDAEGREVAPGAVGEVQVRGPQVFDGYLDDDALNARAFVDGWLRVGDLARIAEDGELDLVGRSQEVVNRGGEKISPLEVDAALRTIAGVADAAAFGVPHPTLGEEVVAAVVLAPGAALREAEIVAAAGARLGLRAAPRRVWIVAALPRNDAGKVLRGRLPDLVGYVSPSARPAGGGATGASPLEAMLAALWGTVLGLDEVPVDRRFRALGGDEARAERLVAAVDAAFGVALAPGALDREAATVAAMGATIAAARRR